MLEEARYPLHSTALMGWPQSPATLTSCKHKHKILEGMHRYWSLKEELLLRKESSSNRCFFLFSGGREERNLQKKSVGTRRKKIYINNCSGSNSMTGAHAQYLLPFMTWCSILFNLHCTLGICWPQCKLSCSIYALME